MRKLGQVAIVFAALLVLVQLPAMATAGFAVAAIWQQGGATAVGLAGVAVLPVLIAVGLAVAIIVKRRELANRLFDDDEVDISVDATSLMRIALVTIGIVLVTQAITGLLYGLSNGITQLVSYAPGMVGEGGAPIGPFVSSVATGPVASLVMIGVGWWLISASGTLSERLFAAPAATSAEEAEPIAEDYGAR